MKADNIKIISKSKGEARVKLLIRAHLYWLEGFPYSDHGVLYWCCPGSAEVDRERVSVTSKMISKAYRVINELQRDYPKALPRVVGDVLEWRNRCELYLDYTKSLQLPSSVIHSLFENNATLKKKFTSFAGDASIDSKLSIAISWSYFIKRDNLKKALEFIHDYHDKYMHSQHYTVIELSQLCYLYSLHGKQAHAFINMHLHPNGISIVTRLNAQYITPFIEYKYKKKRKKPFVVPVEPKENTSKYIASTIRALLGMNSKKRKRVLLLLDSVKITGFIDAYYEWWIRIESPVKAISNIIQYSGEHKQVLLSESQAKLKEYKDIALPDVCINDIFSAIDMFSEDAGATNAIVGFLKSYDSDYPDNVLKPIIVLYFKNCLQWSNSNQKYFIKYIKELSQYIKNDKSPHKMSMWGSFSSNYWSSPENYIFDNISTLKLSNIFSVLSLINKKLKGAISKDWLHGISLIVAVGYKEKDATDLAIKLIELDKIIYISRIVLKISFEQSLTLEKTLRLIDIWNKLDEEYTEEDTLEVVYRVFSKAQEIEIFNYLTFSESFSTLRDLGNKIKIIEKINGYHQVPLLTVIADEEPEWLINFPEKYHKKINELYGLSAISEKGVKKIFFTHWWPKYYLEEELERLYVQLKGGSLVDKESIEKRIINFKKKLIAHASESKAIECKINDKLDRRIHIEKMAVWKQKVQSQFLASWSDFLEIPSVDMPEWLLTKDIVHALLPTVDFRRQSKALVKYIIKQRCFSSDWNCITHPANERFLRELSSNGFNVDLWLHGIGEKSYQSNSKMAITIDVVSDPLDMLNMGGYFKTCLSPGSFNYFSVFSNIADINKRVIYGRNSSGKVIGRVLLGLMSSGGVKIFNIYQHNNEDGFRAEVLAYIESWVERIGFTLTDKGDIPKLVANEWYDDGAINIDSTIKAFQEDSNLREKLRTIHPNSLEDELITELQPLPINELTFPLIMDLKEVAERPDLMPALIVIARKITRLSIHEKIKLFYKAHYAQVGEHCYQLFRQDIYNSLARAIDRERWMDCGLAYDIASYNPSDALRLVKKLGGKGAWQDNLSKESVKVAIKSLTQLGRHQQADTLIKKYKVHIA